MCFIKIWVSPFGIPLFKSSVNGKYNGDSKVVKICISSCFKISSFMCWQVQASISYFPKITSNTLLGSTFMDYSFLNFPLSLYAAYCLYFPNDLKSYPAYAQCLALEWCSGCISYQSKLLFYFFHQTKKLSPFHLLFSFFLSFYNTFGRKSWVENAWHSRILLLLFKFTGVLNQIKQFV